MFWYFVVAYSAALSIIAILHSFAGKRQTASRWIPCRPFSCRIWLHFITAVVLLLPVVPYALIEAQTIVYGSRLTQPTATLLRSQGIDSNWRLFKVMSIVPTRASVYVVCPCEEARNASGKGFAALLITLDRRPGEWRGTEMGQAVWSDCGNANGSTFPPYPDRNAYQRR